MQIPKEGTRRHQIFMNFVEHGSMNVDEFIEKFGLLGIKTKGRLNSEFHDLRNMGVLLKHGDGYSANADIYTFVQKNKPVVKSRTPKPFTQISSKYLLPTVSPRGQSLREMNFINLGASIVEPNRF